MNSEFVKKVALYKELFDAKTISEEQYLSFIKEVVDEQTKEVVEKKDLSFEEKREQLVEENRTKSQELRDRLNEYERKKADEERKRLQNKEQESEISFAIQFLSQIYDSHGNRVYSDELLEDETKMPLYEMQHIIESIRNSSPEKYNEIISKIAPSKAEADLNDYFNKKGISNEDLESTSELTKEEKPKKPKLITRAKDTLMNKINFKNGKINAKLIATAAVIAGITLGVITLGAGAVATAAVTGLSSAVAVGAVSESIKKIK